MDGWRLVTFLALISYSIGIPLRKTLKETESREQNHNVVKRSAEEVLVGNHQNKERVKKAGPPMMGMPAATETKDDETRDETATVAVSGGAARPQVQKSNDQMHKNDEKDKDEHDSVINKAKTDASIENGEFNSDKEDDIEDMLAHIHLPEDSSFRNPVKRRNPGEFRWNLSADRKRRSATARALESSMSAASNAVKTHASRSKRETLYPFLVDDGYKRAASDFYPDYPVNFAYDDYTTEPGWEAGQGEEWPDTGADNAVVLSAGNQWPDSIGNDRELTDDGAGDVLRELAYQVLPAAEAEREGEIPYFGELNSPVPLESLDPYAYPYYRKDQTIPNKRQMLSMMPGIKRSEAFYPYADPEPWAALIPQAAAEKRAVDDQYERLYQLAEALKSERALQDEARKELMDYYLRRNGE